MKYDEVIQKLKDGAEIRYCFNGLEGGDSYTLHYDDDNIPKDEKDNDANTIYIHYKVIKKILGNFEVKYRSMWMQGNEDGGILIIKGLK